VYGEYSVSDKVPTVLIYGHYDVQPPDPLDLWKTPPFEPVEKDGWLFGRGADDDKGQIFAHIKAVEAYLKTTGSLPVNVKFLIEGEEEVSSNNLELFVKNNAGMLRADVALISDGSQYGIDMPSISYGLRGIATIEVKVIGPDRDLHSGRFGGSVANPINMLCRLISRLHDENGHIAINGFYDDVYTAGDWEKQQFAMLPFNEKEYLATTASPGLWGEKGFSTLQRVWTRPTLDCNGITGGYQGEGSKTIIPSWASAKISMRLVPDMDPADICTKAEVYLRKICPDYVTLVVSRRDGCKPVQVPVESPWLDAASSAIEQTFGRKPFFKKEGGSIPIVETFKSVLGIDTLLFGLGQPDSNCHSPNERFLIKDFHRGARTSVVLLKKLAGKRD